MDANYLSPIIDACKPILVFAAVLWGIETIITMLIKGHKSHALRRAPSRQLSLRSLRQGKGGRCQTARRSHRPGIARWQIGNEQSADAMRRLQLR